MNTTTKRSELSERLRRLTEKVTRLEDLDDRRNANVLSSLRRERLLVGREFDRLF